MDRAERQSSIWIRRECFEFYWECVSTRTATRFRNQSDSFALEAKILDFMNQSDMLELFPSQLEVMKAGRSDLVEKILARVGWTVVGWDVEPCIEDQA
ncbi:hypothetical protein KP509_34G065600 [Ceratopteris richardii]|uniref:Uncharacterized protein n=1 Tax=Ceratopteris richardii TaxID=49495 RepID=A0A8T2QKU5_CERRI|nr:hypothetical protein KP509_34G065600 [Ceratopteris richardii]